jgi:hypothetical protein
MQYNQAGLFAKSKIAVAHSSQIILGKITPHMDCAGVAELADAPDSKSVF